MGFRTATPRRRRGRSRRCAHQLSPTVTLETTTGCDGGPSPTPSASMRSTVSMPSVTSPTTAYSGGRPASAPVTTKNWLPAVPGRLDPRLRHRYHALRVGGGRGRDVDRRVSRPAGSRLGRVTALDDESWNDAVEDRVVEVPVAGECNERCARLGRELGVERDRERAAVRLERERVGRRCVEWLRRRLERSRLPRLGCLDALALPRRRTTTRRHRPRSRPRMRR